MILCKSNRQDCIDKGDHEATHVLVAPDFSKALVVCEARTVPPRGFNLTWRAAPIIQPKES